MCDEKFKPDFLGKGFPIWEKGLDLLQDLRYDVAALEVSAGFGGDSCSYPQDTVTKPHAF